MDSKMPSFSRIWRAAIEQYSQDTGLDLEDPSVPHPRDIDEMISMLAAEHAEYCNDTRSGTFSKSLQGAIAPFNFLTSMFGGAAGATFPPSSQILGAITVLVNAGKATTGAFDAVGGLFDELAAFSQRLKEVTKDKVPGSLEAIFQALLVCMLRIIALATKVTFRLIPSDADKRHPHWWKFKQKIGRPAMMNVSQYMKQLLLGQDNEITAAMGTLKRLVDEETKLAGAVTLHNTAVIKEIAVDIQGLSIKVTDVVERVELKVDRISGNVTEIKADTAGIKADTTEIKSETAAAKREIASGFQKQSNNMEAGFGRIETGFEVGFSRLYTQMERFTKSTAAEQQNAATSKSKTSKEGNTAARLEKILSPVSSNEEIYERIRAQRIPGTIDWIVREDHVQAWLDRKHPITMISGASGSGKSFLAARVVDELRVRFKQGIQAMQGTSRVSVGYFFSKSQVKGSYLVGPMLKTLAFQIAINDPAYAKYILSKGSDMPDDDDVRELWDLLFKKPFSRNHTSAFIVIDLGSVEDEEWKNSAEDWKTLLEALKEAIAGDLAQWGMMLQILFLATDSIEAMTAFLGTDIPAVTLDSSMNEKDIELFIREKTRSAWKGKMLDSDLMVEVQKAVQKAANGNFLWAAMEVEELSSLSREDIIRKSLERMPPDLTSAMLLVFKRLSRQLDDIDMDDMRDILAWVACSQRPLSIAELDAILYMRNYMGARVIDLEDRLRDQLGSVFDVSGETEMSQALLHEQYRRRMGQDAWGDDGASVVTVDTELNRFQPELSDQPADLESKEITATTKKKKVLLMSQKKVRFSHSLIAQTVRQGDIREGMEPFRTDQMQAKVLLGCLKTVCAVDDEHWPLEIISTAMSYCGIFVPEHLHDLDIEQVGYEAKTKVVALLIQLLRDETVIKHWTAEAELYMTRDFLTGDMTCLEDIGKWLQDPDVQEVFRRDEKQWLTAAKKAPITTYFHGIAQEMARRWLQERNDQLSSQFRFINAYIDKVENATLPKAADPANNSAAREFTSDVVDETTLMHFGVSYEKKENPDESEKQILTVPEGIDDNAFDLLKSHTARAEADYDLEGSTIERVLEVARWAGFPENALWKARVAAAVRLAQSAADAVPFYIESLTLDPQDGITKAALGYAYTQMDAEHSDEAIAHMKDGAALVSKAIAENQRPRKLIDQMKSSRIWYLQEASGCCWDRDKNDEAIEIYHTIFEDWDPDIDSEADMLQKTFTFVRCLKFMTITTKRPFEAIELLEKLLQQPFSVKKPFANVYHEIGLLEATIIPRIGYETKRLDVLEKLCSTGLKTLARHGAEGTCAAIRCVHALLILRFQPQQFDECIRLLQTVISDPEVVSATSEFHFLHERAEQMLAIVYLEKILQAREQDRWNVVGTNAEALVNLVRQDTDNEGTATLSTRNSSLVLGAWDRINGRTERAKQCVRGILVTGIDMLMDQDPDNDAWAWHNVQNALLAIGDVDGFRTANNIMRMLYTYGNNDALSDKGANDSSSSEENSEKPTQNASEDQVAQNGSLEKSIDSLDPLATSSEGQKLKTTLIDEASTTAVRTEAPDTITTNKDVTAEQTSNVEVADSTANNPVDPNKADNPEPREEVSKSNKDDQVISDPLESASWYGCDGPCFSSILNKDIVWRCSFCFQDFCNSCHELIKAGKMEDWHICSNLHEHFDVPGISEKYPAGMIMASVNGREEYVSTKDWLETLRKDWGLATS